MPYHILLENLLKASVKTYEVKLKVLFSMIFKTTASVNINSSSILTIMWFSSYSGSLWQSIECFFIKFGTVIEESLGYLYSKFAAHHSSPLTPPVGQIWKYVHKITPQWNEMLFHFPLILWVKSSHWTPWCYHLMTKQENEGKSQQWFDIFWPNFVDESMTVCTAISRRFV